MFRNTNFYLFLVFIFAFQTLSAQRVSDYDVVWDTPSENASGAMPLGNGELGVNLWVERNGDLLFYISRTDSWSETARLLKIGKVRMSFTPNIFADGKYFQQRLNLENGSIDIIAGDLSNPVKLTVFADPNDPVLHITGEGNLPIKVTAISEPWRTEAVNVAIADSLRGIRPEWTRASFYDYDRDLVESADVFADAGNAVVWYHRNEHSVFDLTLRQMELESLKSKLTDPVLHRTFGVYMASGGFRKADAHTLETPIETDHFALKLAVHTAQTDEVETWIDQAQTIWSESANTLLAQQANRDWWKNFWDKSWIFVETPDGISGEMINRSYILQNWITVCGGRGNYPIKFNGTIFTVEPQYTDPQIVSTPDHRNWGGAYWWQNTRLPYYPMLYSGDFEMLKPLFAHYQRLLPSFRTIADEFFQAEGAIIPETASIFGLYNPGNYGWDRTGLKKGEITNMYIRHEWNGALELISLMLDYYDYTNDTDYLVSDIIPTANEFLTFFHTKFPTEKGVMKITPTQSLETYWYDVVNDLPNVAGLRAVLDRLQTLPHGIGSKKDRELWTKMQKKLPAIPTRMVNGATHFAPAEAFEDKLNNSEVPELYSVFPFYLTHLGTDDRQTGIDTYHARKHRGPYGWRQDGQMAALLGLTDEAKENMLRKVLNSHPGHRFPAIWGPNFDWTPDQDHGGNLLTTLQMMVLQSHGSDVFLLPAFPKDWNVNFKLFVRGGNTVEGVYRNGQWEKQPTVTGAAAKLIDCTLNRP